MYLIFPCLRAMFKFLIANLQIGLNQLAIIPLVYPYQNLQTKYADCD